MIQVTKFIQCIEPPPKRQSDVNLKKGVKVIKDTDGKARSSSFITNFDFWKRMKINFFFYKSNIVFLDHFEKYWKKMKSSNQGTNSGKLSLHCIAT